VREGRKDGHGAFGVVLPVKRWSLVASAGVALLTGTGCGRSLSEDECGALMERYTELLIISDRRDVNVYEREKLKAEAKERATRDAEFRKCSSEVSRRQFECAIAAHHVDEMERCLL
jgi:hypothetical protein